MDGSLYLKCWHSWTELVIETDGSFYIGIRAFVLTFLCWITVVDFSYFKHRHFHCQFQGYQYWAHCQYVKKNGKHDFIPLDLPQKFDISKWKKKGLVLCHLVVHIIIFSSKKRKKRQHINIQHYFSDGFFLLFLTSVLNLETVILLRGYSLKQCAIVPIRP